MDECLECKQPLVEIDNRRRHLTGCMTCNIWWSADGKKVRLSEQDLAGHCMRCGGSSLLKKPRRCGESTGAQSGGSGKTASSIPEPAS